MYINGLSRNLDFRKPTFPATAQNLTKYGFSLTRKFVHSKFFSWWVRKYETISTKKFAFLIVTLWFSLVLIFARILYFNGEIYVRENPYSAILSAVSGNINFTWYLWIISFIDNIINFKSTASTLSRDHKKQSPGGVL